MTFTEAAAEVLRLAGKPLHYKEITELAIEKNLLSHVGKNPEVTMGARLAALLKKEEETNPIVRVKPGVFALRDWPDDVHKGLAKADVEAASDDDDAGDTGGINALEVEAAARETTLLSSPTTSQPHLDRLDEDDEDDGRSWVSSEDALRADLAAQGAELFDDEDDDDEPILAAPAPATSEPGTDVGRRRRRRRRRGRGGAGDGQRTEAGSADPGSSDSLERDGGAPARPLVRERHQIMAGGSPTGIDVPGGNGEAETGRELADVAAQALASLDRGGQSPSLRAVAEALLRRGRLSGDPASATLQLGASMRADNLRQSARGARPRFRFPGSGRVSLVDTGWTGDLVRAEQDLAQAVERYRDASRRLLLRRVQELPGYAFVELALTVLERAGYTDVRAVRRSGTPGGELHYSAMRHSGVDDVQTAVVIRKDGREVGRERVSDLRGALHHYGPAAAGCILTTGQVLSGAREEASVLGAAPVTLLDGLAVCRLLEDLDVAVVRTPLAVACPDLDFLESLRA